MRLVPSYEVEISWLGLNWSHVRQFTGRLHSKHLKIRWGGTYRYHASTRYLSTRGGNISFSNVLQVSYRYRAYVPVLCLAGTHYRENYSSYVRAFFDREQKTLFYGTVCSLKYIQRRIGTVPITQICNLAIPKEMVKKRLKLFHIAKVYLRKEGNIIIS